MTKKYQAFAKLLHDGAEEKGWRGTPFYWPVLLVQKNVRSAVYGSSET